MSAQPISALPAGFDSYIRHGWHLVPIPPNSKGPINPGWNEKANCITDPSKVPQGYGVGLAHAYSGTMALDIDDPSAVELLAEHGIVLKDLFLAPDAVSIDSGNPGHGKLIYSMPFGLVMPSKKVSHKGKTAFELRCASASGLTVQDVLPPTVHPISCRPYQWSGKGDWRSLPVIPTALLTLWQSIIDKDSERIITVGGSIDASWDEIRTALLHIDADVTRDDWIACGMALHHAGCQTNQVDTALQLWDEWSAKGTKYKGQAEIQQQWKSFKGDKTDGIKLGTLFKLAKDAGWKRPTPDVSAMFTSVSPIDPKSVMASLDNPPPECDLSVFPQVIVDRAMELSTAMAADPLVSIMAGLGAVCAAADSRTRLRITYGYEVPPVLWLMTIGAPAAKKSPASKPMYAVLAQLEKEDVPRYAKAMLNYELHESTYASSKKAALSAAADPANILGGDLDMSRIPTVYEMPPRPIPLRLTVDDVTSQKLVRMVADRPAGVLVCLDEMLSWVNKITSSMSGEDRSAWTKGYEASRYVMDRVGDGKGLGCVEADNFALSVYGNIQPNALKKKLADLSIDGLMQRFIPVILRDHYSDKVGDPGPVTHDAAYEQMIRTVFTLPVMTYKLSAAAYEVYRAFQEWHVILKRDDRLLRASDDYMQAIGKMEGTCGRLILVWHLIERPYQTEIGADTVERVVRFVTSYVVPSLRYVYGDLSGANASTLERWLTAWIVEIATERATITLREIKRSCRRQIEGLHEAEATARVREALWPMEQWGWIATISDDSKSTVYAINPGIAESHKTYRQAIIDARERRRKELHDNFPKN